MIVRRNKAWWGVRENIVNFLAEELNAGRLALCLGAGVSQRFGLPSWLGLIDRLRNLNGLVAPRASNDEIDEFDKVFAQFYADQPPEKYAIDTQSVLWDGTSVDAASLNASPLLSALGAVLMNTARKAPTTVLTLNYDDLVEQYLALHGFKVLSVGNPVHFVESCDVIVYHPHGFLPLDKSKPSISPVLGTKDYAEVMSVDSLWRSTFTHLMRTHTPVFIGLSGKDLDLRHVANDVKKRHPATQMEIPYFGVLINKVGEIKGASALETMGLLPFEVPDFDDVPAFLYSILQASHRLEAGAMMQSPFKSV